MSKDKLEPLRILAALSNVEDVMEVYGYYIITFEDSLASLMYDPMEVTREEIQAVIDEVKS